MIDIDNYKRAVQWLRRVLAELDRDPENPHVQLSVLQSFEVTHNLSEGILRETYLALADDAQTPYISIRELILRAGDEGVVLSSPKQWLQYGLTLETIREACILSDNTDLRDTRELLSRFAQELESFARSLERRLATHV